MEDEIDLRGLRRNPVRYLLPTPVGADQAGQIARCSSSRLGNPAARLTTTALPIRACSSAASHSERVSLETAQSKATTVTNRELPPSPVRPPDATTEAVRRPVNGQRGRAVKPRDGPAGRPSALTGRDALRRWFRATAGRPTPTGGDRCRTYSWAWDTASDRTGPSTRARRRQAATS